MATVTETDPKRSLGEPDAYLAARHMCTGVRVLLALSLVATVVLLLFYRQAAYLAAIPIPVLLVISVALDYMKSRSQVTALRQPGQTTISQEEIDLDIETIGVITILKILGILAIGTFIVAAAFYDIAVVGAAAAAGFLLAILIELPFLPLFLTESERDERERLTGSRD